MKSSQRPLRLMKRWLVTMRSAVEISDEVNKAKQIPLTLKVGKVIGLHLVAKVWNVECQHRRGVPLGDVYKKMSI